jgi:hypothetical protein
VTRSIPEALTAAAPFAAWSLLLIVSCLMTWSRHRRLRGFGVVGLLTGMVLGGLWQLSQVLQPDV